MSPHTEPPASEPPSPSSGAAGDAAGLWQDALARELVGGGVDVAAQVPDSRLDGVVRGLVARDLRVRTLPREEECIGFAAGVRLAGGKPLVLMQCSGLGNALNAVGSLAIPYGLGIPLVLSMRGTLGEANPAQIPLGRATTALLEALGIQWFSVRDDAGAVTVARGVLRMAYEGGAVAAILLEPELGGARAHR